MRRSRAAGVLVAACVAAWAAAGPAALRAAQVAEEVDTPGAQQPVGDDARDAETGLPPIPDDDGETGLPPIAPDEEPGVAGALAVEVKGFRFEGNTVFSDEQLRRAPVETEPAGEGVLARTRVGDYVNQSLTAEGLEAIRQALTRLYIGAGYINSGAVLPDQDVEGGVVLYRLVEGRLTDVNLTYVDAANRPVNGRLRPRYLISRVRRGAGEPLNLFRLRDQLEIVRQDPNLTRITAELRPGAEPGEAYLDAQVTESNPFQLGAQVSNRRSPSVGAEQVEILASHRNLSGNGDVLALRYGVNTGGFDAWEFAGLDDVSVDYGMPITPADTTLLLSYTRTDSLVVEEPFDELDIESESNSAAVALRHPFYRTANTELAMFVGLAYRDNLTTLDGSDFSFSPGADDGESVVAPVRFGQELSTRSQLDAFALRSTFSIGTGLFGATLHGEVDVPDAHYLSWLGQAQYVRRVNPLVRGYRSPLDFFRPDPAAFDPLADWQLVLRGSAQAASDPMLSIEQFALGGVDTVRGYRENQIVRDMGAAASVELHIPVVATTGGARVLELIPFADVGYGFNIDGKIIVSDPTAGGFADDVIERPRDSRFLSSVGLGVQFTPNRHVNAQVYWGYALNRNVNDESDDLQDAGIHFNVLVLAF
jgi:hemolysin activation/secretion protein